MGQLGLGLIFKTGVALSGLLLIKIHLVLSLIVYLIFAKLFNFEMGGNIGFVIYLLIAMIGHVRATFNCYKEMDSPEKELNEPKDFDEALDPKKNLATQALIWRFKTEWLYMKKTANFDFKRT